MPALQEPVPQQAMAARRQPWPEHNSREVHERTCLVGGRSPGASLFGTSGGVAKSIHPELPPWVLGFYDDRIARKVFHSAMKRRF